MYIHENSQGRRRRLDNKKITRHPTLFNLLYWIAYINKIYLFCIYIYTLNRAGRILPSHLCKPGWLTFQRSQETKEEMLLLTVQFRAVQWQRGAHGTSDSPQLLCAGCRPVKEEMSGLHLPPPQKSQDKAEGNLLEAAPTLQPPPASQPRSHPQCFYFLFPIWTICSEFMLNYSVAGHHRTDNSTKKNETYKGVCFTTGF